MDVGLCMVTRTCTEGGQGSRQHAVSGLWLLYAHRWSADVGCAYGLRTCGLVAPCGTLLSDVCGEEDGPHATVWLRVAT